MSNAKPSLMSIAVVSRLLRDAFGNAIMRRGDYFAGQAPDAAQKDIADMQGLASALQGGDPTRYDVQPWNSASQMGKHVKQTYGMECAQDDAVFTLLLYVLGTMYEKIDASSAGSDPTEQIDVLIEQTTAALLGLPGR
jgi:hypothetical protein